MKLIAFLIIFIALSQIITAYPIQDPNKPFTAIETQEKEEIKENTTIINIDTNKTTITEHWKNMDKIDKTFTIITISISLGIILGILYIIYFARKIKKR